MNKIEYNHGKHPNSLKNLTKKGQKLSLKTRERMSLAHTGMKKPWAAKYMKESRQGKTFEMLYGKEKALKIRKKLSESKTGEKNNRYRTKHTEESKRKMSKSHVGKPSWIKGRTKEDTPSLIRKRGKESHKWQGGITHPTRKRVMSKKWKKIADTIRKRDSNTCRKCGKVGKRKLKVHHIIPWYKSKNDSPINLLTLCASCHMTMENNYRRLGLTGFMKRYMRENLKIYMEEIGCTHLIKKPQ